MASKREANKEHKRQAILNAAAKEFALKSYYGTNCAQIASSAGVAVGTIYEHFVDKQDVANKLYQRAYERYLDNFLSEVRETDSAEVQFKQAWHGFYRVLETNRDEFLFTELQFHESYLDETSKRVRSMVRSVFGAWAQRLINSGQVNVTQVETVFSLMIGTFTRQVKVRLEANTPLAKGFLDELIEVTWQSMRRT